MGLRSLGAADVPVLQYLCDQQPYETMFIASRVAQFGADPRMLGATLFGFERNGSLAAALHHGTNLVPIGDPNDDEAIVAFAAQVGPRRGTKAILGPQQLVLKLHRALSRLWGDSWAVTRQVREHQPVMALGEPPHLPGDRRVRIVNEAELEGYYRAAVSMYKEEVGGDAADSGDAYKMYVRSLLAFRRAFGAEHQGEFWFKADIGACAGPIGQIQGVWLRPDLRSRGMAEPALAQAVTLMRTTWPIISLYVNDYNTPAIRAYQRLGFQPVGELATVLY
ncbi:MAG: GNAT family N-acetyltransferase [Propionibacteriaceae bacterium]|nr:GNAT family N-acetyltransferase [Propionibacteriaceae bacterium]